MTLTVENLSELDQDTVAASAETVTQLVQDYNPRLDVKRGVFRDLVINMASILLAARREEIERYRRSASLLEIENDPELADEDVVDRVLSNYLLERRAGEAAVGEVKIVVSQLSPVVVSAGSRFVANGSVFLSQESYSAVTSSANVISETDRLLVLMADGNYAFTISVEAEVVEESIAITKDTAVEPDFTLANFVQAYAASDFSAGRGVETNSALLARMREGIAAKTMSNRTNMTAFLRESFPGVVGSSVIGFGDPEQLRDQHSVLPVSLGGRVDWYVRSNTIPTAIGLVKEATLISRDVDSYGTFQFSLARDEVPGFYNIAAIRPEGSEIDFGTFEITEDIRNYDLANILGELTPDIVSVEEAAYSRYQTATIRFKDTLSSAAGLTVGSSVRNYDVTVRAMPDIAEIQAFAGIRGNRFCGGDILVKAPIPCYLSLSFTVQGKSGSTMPDPYEIQQALTDYVNNLNFPGRLYSAALSDLIHNFLDEGVSLSAIDMFGQIRKPDGSLTSLRSKEVLIIPDDEANMVSPRTVAFILLPENIAISGETLGTPDI